MIEQQIFALEMNALTSRLQRLQLDNKIVTLLHELWDKMKIGGRRKVEITTNEDGMEPRDHQGERVNPHIDPLTRVIHLNLFLDMVPSSSANFTRAIFLRCEFSWRKQRRRVMADRASSKRKFEVSNAPSKKRKKTSPNLFCSKERTCTL